MRDSSDRVDLLLLGLIFLLAIAPFDPGAGRDLVPITLIALAAVVLATVFARRALARRWPGPARHSPASAPLVFLLLVAAGSLAWSIDPFVSLVGLARLLGCAVVFLLVVNEFRGASSARTLCVAVVAIACLLSLLGVWQALLGRGLFPAGAGARAHAVFVTPNTFAGYLVIALPLAVALAATAGQRGRRLLGWAAAGLLALALVLSRSRGGWLAGAAGMLFFVWHLARIRGLGGRRRLRLLAGATASMALIAVAAGLASPGLRRRALSLVHPGRAASLNERVLYWRSAGQMARESLPLGTGLDTFHVDYPAHQHPSLGGTRQWFAHNDLLQVTTELGLLGLVALAWFLWQTGRMAGEVLHCVVDRREGIVLVACIAGAGGALGHSLIEYHLCVPATAFAIFLCLGVVAAAWSRHVQGHPPAEPAAAPTGRRYALSVAALGAGTVAAFLAVLPLAGYQLLDREETVPYAPALCPIVSNYWIYLGHARSSRDAAGAAKAYERAIRLSPRSAPAHAFLGALLLGRGGQAADRGRAELDRACELDPHSAPLRWHVAASYLDAGQAEDAARNLRVLLGRCRPEPVMARRARDLLSDLEGSPRAARPDQTALLRPAPPPEKD